ncbi:DUF262 domain-containing protein [Halomonas sp. LBP4]|uniref:DUF262 domain-containing protein n=1 Tax=Halomonas sp. LBP4 TaxID=2044917 RepID=UPI000D767341|nr:DUF262 domain-containing protein [Halomonas sp. LBP4]PXX95926.1 hypothetical protein CR157_17160 [Halomonas sp. LBP4]
MDAKARDLNQIFDSTISFQIPLFQRPYVWREEQNWAPLWEDIQGLMDHRLRTQKSRTHFLGAVVLEQMRNVAGSIETHQVIDGQQRFTTLQIFMIAARDICHQLDSGKYYERFADLVGNKASKVDFEHERYKVWPTNSDREAFKLVHGVGGLEPLEQRLQEQPKLHEQNQQVIDGYRYFYRQLALWLHGELDEKPGEEAPDLDERLDALWQVVSNALQVVVINLSDDDESQVIFETLNARGTQLLPADLIKNYLFRRAQSEGQDIESLYEQHWKAFDAKFWRKEVKQGRTKRPRIDLFLQHYLALMLREDVRSAHLFEAFKEYVVALEEGEKGSELTAQPNSIESHLQSLSRYARAFRKFAEPEAGLRLATFLDRLQAVDTATVYPLLLLASDQLLPADQGEFDRVLVVLESFLVRRMICCMTTKNYNRLFIDVIKALDRRGKITAQILQEVLQANEGDSVRFPTDDELRQSILNTPIYKHLAQYKIRAVLGAIDLAQEDRKSEALPLPDNLTIEHIMPVKWQASWPMPEDVAADPEKRLAFNQERNRQLHTLGNLTLITGSLNPSLSNASWDQKRPELCKYSKLNLNRYFHPPKEGESDALREWNEATIEHRGQALYQTARSIWPYQIGGS